MENALLHRRADYGEGRTESRPAAPRSATLDLVRETRQSFEVECPHCHRTFSGRPIEGSAPRYRGFKCPHCKLFVPYERVEEQDLLEPLSRDLDGA